MITQTPNQKPKVIIIGAGISGLLLAQYLRKCSIPFAIFERDTDFHTRGVGWGLTLHWSLPALRSLLPSELVDRLPETYVDREAVERGEVSTFPFYDLATGILKGKSPPAPESQRIRVTRERFRRLLAEGIEINWGRSYKGYEISVDEAGEELVAVSFEDGTSCSGSLLVGCDGGRSRVRRDLLPGSEKGLHKIPVGVLGVKVEYSPERIQSLRQLDPFFFQGTSSEHDTFVYFSMLDAPVNRDSKSSGKYTCQIVVSWPLQTGFFGGESITPCPATNEDRLQLIRTFAQTWAEPFKSLVLDIPPGTEIKPVDLHDWPPPLSLELSDQPVTLMGDAFHPMAMYRGEGANHAILDVLDFATTVFPKRQPEATMEAVVGRESSSNDPGSSQDPSAFFKSEFLPARLKEYTDKVAERTRPAVLASRRACMDAHNYKMINPASPLVSRRAMMVEFEDETLGWDY